MERFIMVVMLSDGCSYQCATTYPIYGESMDALVLEAIILRHNADGSPYMFKGVVIDHYCDDPIIYTLDEWFASATKE